MRRKTSSSVGGFSGTREVVMSCSVDELAGAIYWALKQCDKNAFIEDFSLEDPVTIDGSYQLRALALLLQINLHGLFAQALSPVEQKRQETSAPLPRSCPVTLG